MKKQCFALLLAGLLLLCSCQLADPALAHAQPEEPFVGFYVTSDDTHTWEDYDRFTQAADGSYTLAGGDGWLFAPPYGIDAAFSDVTSQVWEADGRTSQVNHGTLYAVSQAEMPVFCFNPVCRDSESRLYILRGSGMSFSGDNSPGMSSSYKLDSTASTTENGKTSEQSVSYEVTLTIAAAPTAYTFVSMDEQYQVLSSETFTPDTLPDTIHPADGAAFLVVQTHSLDSSGTECITRTIHTRDSQTLSLVLPGSNGICIQQTCPIQW